MALPSLGPDRFVMTLAVQAPGILQVPWLESLSRRLGENGGKAVRTVWRRSPTVADIEVSSVAVEKIRQILADQIGALPIDAVVQLAERRVKKALIADMESTIIGQELLDELAQVCGLGEAVAAITRRGMEGKMSFQESLRARVLLLKGVGEDRLNEVAQRITFTSGAAELVAAVKKQGGVCWLASGGFDLFARRVAQSLGFDNVMANAPCLADGKLNGQLVEPIFDAEGKRRFMLEAVHSLGIPSWACVAVGDGANDIPMLCACKDEGGLGAAYRAKAAVRAAVPDQINYTDLSTLALAISAA